MKLTAKQVAAQEVMSSDATHVMLFGGSRCVAGDTVLDGQTETIAALAIKGKPVEVLTTWGKQWASPPFRKGTAALIDVETYQGRSIRVTPDHRFWTGEEWIRADQLYSDCPLAVRSFALSPRQSSSAPGPSTLTSDGPRLTETLASFEARCLAFVRRCDLRLRLEEASGLTYYASSFDAPARNPTSDPSQARGSGSHIRYQRPHDGADNPSDPALFRQSKTDGIATPYLGARSQARVCGQTSAQSPRSHSTWKQWTQMSHLARSAQSLVHSAFFRFCRLFGLSCDTPSVGGYGFDNVLRVTQAATEDYYTLHVPVAEQYFANGILHHNSGKTFLMVRNIVMRALKAKKSRHAIFRYRFNAIKSSVIQDTFPKVMELAFPGVDYNLNKSDSFVTFPNGSELWFAGLDEKERAEKVLGMEFVTIGLNECSQIPKTSRDLVLTRLAQQVVQQLPGSPVLKPRMYYDENPPSKGHWSYKLFIQKLDPDTKEPLNHPADYAWFKINPHDNAENISDGYLETLQGMSARFRQRFLEGNFSDDNPNALFTDTTIETWRVMDGVIPQMVRVVVAVDPSGSGDEDNADNDAIGIVVAGLGIDGNAYVLEDCTIKAGPATWGRIATDAYDRHRADCIVGEINYGGAMVRQTIQTARPRTPFKQVTATRGKAVRAEPFSALYEQGKVRHVGLFAPLEDELTAFSTFGYTGSGSPNRADAAVWALAELFPGIVAGPRVERAPRPARQVSSWAA